MAARACIDALPSRDRIVNANVLALVAVLILCAVAVVKALDALAQVFVRSLSLANQLGRNAVVFLSMAGLPFAFAVTVLKAFVALESKLVGRLSRAWALKGCADPVLAHFTWCAFGRLGTVRALAVDKLLSRVRTGAGVLLVLADHLSLALAIVDAFDAVAIEQVRRILRAGCFLA